MTLPTREEIAEKLIVEDWLYKGLRGEALIEKIQEFIDARLRPAWKDLKRDNVRLNEECIRLADDRGADLQRVTEHANHYSERVGQLVLERDAERTRYVMADAGWKEMNRQNEELKADLRVCAEALVALCHFVEHNTVKESPLTVEELGLEGDKNCPPICDGPDTDGRTWTLVRVALARGGPIQLPIEPAP